MKNRICTVQSRISNNRDQSRYISQKDPSRIRTRIIQIKEMAQKSKLPD